LEKILLYSVFFLGIMFSELAFVFGVCLVLIEFAFRIKSRLDKSKSPVGRVGLYLDGTFIADFIAILTFLALYVGFRLCFPSTYEGNQISSIPSINATIATLIGHISGGTSFSAFYRNDTLNIENLSALMPWDISLCVFVFLATFIYFQHAANNL